MNLLFADLVAFSNCIVGIECRYQIIFSVFCCYATIVNSCVKNPVLQDVHNFYRTKFSPLCQPLLWYTTPIPPLVAKHYSTSALIPQGTLTR